jgi:heme/copper-type cytochrome/quinol oxidase subunit 2
MRSVRRLRVITLAALAAALLVIAVPVGADDYKQAPPAEELDRQASDYITNRRIVAVLLIGGTLVGGMIGSIARRRARRRARREDSGHGES